MKCDCMNVKYVSVSVKGRSVVVVVVESSVRHRSSPASASRVTESENYCVTGVEAECSGVVRCGGVLW